MTTREFDAGALLDGNIDSVTAVFGDHDDAQLATLLDVEKAGKKRAGLVEAIEREQATRKADAEAVAAKTKDEAAAKAKADADAKAASGVSTSLDTSGGGERTFTQAEVDAIHAEHGTALAAANAESAGAIGSLTNELADARRQLSARAAKPPRAVKVEGPRKLALLGKAGDGVFRVAFGDDRDMSIAVLPELEFGAGDFEPVKGGGVTLTRPIDFAEGSPGARVSAVWLVNGKGEAGAVSRLVQPLAVGGGGSAQIPAKFLNFVGGGAAAAA